MTFIEGEYESIFIETNISNNKTIMDLFKIEGHKHNRLQNRPIQLLLAPPCGRISHYGLGLEV